MEPTFKGTIGIGGPALAGKDTTADLLSRCFEDHGHKVLVASLAEELKQQCADATGYPRAWFDDPEYKEHLRPLMQYWGDIRKNPVLGGNPLYWCQHLLSRIPLNVIAEADTLICPDVRYDFEATYIKDMAEGEGVTIRIETPMTLGRTAHSSHSSEAGLSDEVVTHIINNPHKGVEKYDVQIKEFAYLGLPEEFTTTRTKV